MPDNAWDWSLFDTYPHVPWAKTAAWRRQAARAYDDLAFDIDIGIWPLPRCPAEELALHTLLARLRDWTSDREAFPTLSEELAPLPPHPDDENWNGAWAPIPRPRHPRPVRRSQRHRACQCLGGPLVR